MEKTAYHHGDLRSALLDLAEEHLRQAPDAPPSVRTLAAELGVSATAPHAHFRTKSDLLTALAVRGFERLGAALLRAKSSHPDPETQLTALAEAYLVFASENVGLYRLMFSTGTTYDADAELRRVSRAAYDVLRDTIGRSVAPLSDLERNERALAAWGVVHGLASLAAEERISDDTLADRTPSNLARITGRLVAGSR
ncbi:MAG: TetR/AcrR family transcriptional regulator [Pseudomonadota bacterium]